MSDGLSTLIVGLAAVVGTIVVAMISRRDPDPATPSQPDLTTIAGLAAAFTEARAEQARQAAEQGRQISELQGRQRLQERIIGAFRRRSGVLEDAMRAAGVPIPDLDPADAALMSGST